MTANTFDIAAYNYELPQENIAQEPSENRHDSRLLVLDCRTDERQDRTFGDILDLLAPGDLLVVNDTRVFPARLEGRKETGGRVEFFLLGHPEAAAVSGKAENGWRQVTVTGLLKSSKRPKTNAKLLFSASLYGIVQKLLPDGKVRVVLHFQGDLGQVMEDCGRMPLPPYIKRERGEKPEDRERYQTIYAKRPGAVAAPTAGLHFSAALLEKIRNQGVKIAPLTLHVGYGTFAPVRATDIRDHEIHEEFVEIPQATADLINETVEGGGKIWVVGTTTARSLEFAADKKGNVQAKKGWCGLYIYPGYRFKLVRNLITNFHLPGSSLLFLVSALAGRERIMAAYQQAVADNYRFYSYGDAMVIITE